MFWPLPLNCKYELIAQLTQRKLMRIHYVSLLHITEIYYNIQLYLNPSIHKV